MKYRLLCLLREALEVRSKAKAQDMHTGCGVMGEGEGEGEGLDPSGPGGQGTGAPATGDPGCVPAAICDPHALTIQASMGPWCVCVACGLGCRWCGRPVLWHTCAATSPLPVARRRTCNYNLNRIILCKTPRYSRSTRAGWCNLLNTTGVFVFMLRLGVRTCVCRLAAVLCPCVQVQRG